MKKLWLLLILSNALYSVEFNYQAKLSSATESLREVELPIQVHQLLSDYKNRSFYIYDAQNKEMASMPSTAKIDAKIQTIKLNFFIKPELYKHLFNHHTGDELAHKSIIFIENRDKISLTSMLLEWNHKTDTSLSLEFHIKSSEDLSSWRSIGSNSLLYDLNHLGENIQNKQIQLNHPSNAKYFALIFKGSQNGIAKLITSVRAKYNINTHKTLPLKTEKIKEIKYEEKTIYFSLPRDIDIKTLNITSSDNAYFFKGTVYTGEITQQRTKKERIKDKIKTLRKKEKLDPVSWDYVTSFSQYKIITKKGNIQSEDIPIRKQNRYKKWKVVFQTSINQNIKLHFSWKPKHVTFLAAGTEPYYLRFAKKWKVPQPIKLQKSFATLTQAQKVNLGVIENISEKSTYAPPQNSNQQRWILWLIMFIGLIVIYYMGIKVYKDMKKHG